MIETITVGNKSVEMRADGATPFLFKQAFGKDLLKIFSDTNISGDAAEISELVAELGFVMAQQASSPDPLQVNLSKGEFMRFLMQFEPLDIANAGEDIINLYIGTFQTDSVAKKKTDQLTEN